MNIDLLHQPTKQLPRRRKCWGNHF